MGMEVAHGRHSIISVDADTTSTMGTTAMAFEGKYHENDARSSGWNFA